MADTTNILNETTITDPITATLDSAVELSPATEAPGAFVSSVSEAHTETPAESFSKAVEVGAAASEALPPDMEYAFSPEIPIPSYAFEKEVRITSPDHDLPVSSEVFFNEEDDAPEASPASGSAPWKMPEPAVSPEGDFPEKGGEMPDDPAEPVSPMSAPEAEEDAMEQKLSDEAPHFEEGSTPEQEISPEVSAFEDTAAPEQKGSPEVSSFEDATAPEQKGSPEVSSFEDATAPEQDETNAHEFRAQEEDGLCLITDYLKDEGYDHLMISYEEEDMILVKTSRLDKIMEIRFVKGEFSSLSIKPTKVSYSQIVISFIKEAIKFGRLSNIKRISGQNTVPVE